MIDKNNSNENLTNTNTNAQNTEKFNFDSYFELHPEKKSEEFISFLAWFVGYSEGNASITTAQNKQFPNSFSTQFQLFSTNLDSLRYIQKNLDFGLIYTSKYKNGEIFYSYRVQSKETINKIMCIFNGNAMLNITIKQMRYWNETSVNYTKPNSKITILPQANKISLNNSWLSGFIDADGCFGASLFKTKNVKSGFALKLMFVLAKQNTLSVLETIRMLLNSQGKILQDRKGENIFRLQIQNIASFNILINYLKIFPLRTKGKNLSLANWQKLFKYNYQEHLAPIVFDKKAFTKLKKQIKSINLHSIRSPQYKKKLNKNESK